MASMAEVGALVAQKFGLRAAKIRPPPQGSLPPEYLWNEYLRDSVRAEFIRHLIQTLYIDEVAPDGRGQGAAGAGQAQGVANQYIIGMQTKSSSRGRRRCVESVLKLTGRLSFPL